MRSTINKLTIFATCDWWWGLLFEDKDQNISEVHGKEPWGGGGKERNFSISIQKQQQTMAMCLRHGSTKRKLQVRTQNLDFTNFSPLSQPPTSYSLYLSCISLPLFFFPPPPPPPPPILSFLLFTHFHSFFPFSYFIPSFPTFFFLVCTYGLCIYTFIKLLISVN